jgi:LDH2 family malate/lactate/ureidoglycolate dehydrogenase
MGSDQMSFSSSALRRFISDAFLAVGLPPGSAQSAADVLATADEFGVSTHGVKLLPGYLARLKAGGTRPQGRPHVTREGAAWAHVDGDAALGALIGVFSMPSQRPDLPASPMLEPETGVISPRWVTTA